jgi:hypothetical protein
MLGALTLWRLHFSVSDYEGKYTSIPLGRVLINAQIAAPLLLNQLCWLSKKRKSSSKK